MFLDFSEYKLPPVYKRNDQDYYLDPIRKRLIKMTPEETVRQQVISYLIEELKVPSSMIRVEEHLSHYGINSKRRADIIVEKYIEKDNAVEPLLIIECKAPGVLLGEKTVNQMLDYADAIYCDYVMATDGSELLCVRYDEKSNSYMTIDGLPEYTKMIQGEFTPIPEIKRPPRLTIGEIEEGDNWRAYHGSNMGRNTNKIISTFAINFWEALVYEDHRMPEGQYELFRLIEDYGRRLLSYGNASGGLFSGVYRSFLIEYKGSTEFVSIGMSPYVTWAHQDVEKTVLSVAIDNEMDSHHSLQFVLDDNLGVVGNRYILYHHGRISVGNKGSGKVAELRELVKEMYPKIIDGNRFNLGTLVNDHLWNLDEKDMMEVIEKLISYALIRDEYRNMVKENA